MSQEVYELENGLERIKNRIIEIQKEYHGPIIVGVAGGSGSGKTTKVAQKIQEMFACAKILSIDDYFWGEDIIRDGNWDAPRAYDLGRLKDNVGALRAGYQIQKPVYSFKTGRRVGYENFESPNITVLEGLYALYPGVVGYLELKIFVDIAVHGSLLRRLIRDVQRTGQTEQEIFEQYVSTVYPMFKLHIEPTKASADIVITNQYVPEIEAAGCETREIQIKATLPESITLEKLKKLSFVSAGIVYQEDTYYLAPNWPDDHGDEMIRIRREGNRYFLAYKGPQEEGSFRIKPKIEFEVKPSSKDALRQLGYKEMLTFGKTREKFLNSGLEVVIDQFTNGYRFLEFRTADLEGEKEIFKCLKELGMDKSLITKKSYLELMMKK